MLPRRTKYLGRLVIVFLVTVLLNFDVVEEDDGVDVAVWGALEDEVVGSGELLLVLVLFL